MRSVVVMPRSRGEGFGRAIVEGLVADSHTGGAAEAYLLTTNAAPFFAHLGFREVARHAAPAAILATRQASTICSTAALLSRHIQA